MTGRLIVGKLRHANECLSLPVCLIFLSTQDFEATAALPLAIAYILEPMGEFSLIPALVS